jgi:hypothetical protein
MARIKKAAKWRTKLSISNCFYVFFALFRGNIFL